MTATVYAKNKRANAINFTKASIHSGSPGTDGLANTIRELTQQEIDDGKTPYSDQPITLGSAVNGVRNATVTPKFNIPSGETASHYALWEDDECVEYAPLPNSEDYNGHGTYEAENIKSTSN